MRTTFILLLSLISVSCLSQQEEQEVGKTIDRFFMFLSFPDTSHLQIDSLRNVFVSEGKLINNFGKKPLIFTVHEYIAGIRTNVSSGQLHSTQEKELARNVDVFGKIAHVLSTFELTMVGKDGKMVRRGINSIQLLKLDGRWLILSLIWDRESDVLKLPSKYLSKSQ